MKFCLASDGVVNSKNIQMQADINVIYYVLALSDPVIATSI
jgi:hypothetical protein